MPIQSTFPDPWHTLLGVVRFERAGLLQRYSWCEISLATLIQGVAPALRHQLFEQPSDCGVHVCEEHSEKYEV